MSRRQPEDRRAGVDPPASGRAARRRTASTGTRRSSSPATTRRSSTAAATTSSARSTAATTCRPSRRRSRSPSAASPRPCPNRRATPNVLYVGTDDGGLWVTHDGGHEWTDIAQERRACPARAGSRPSRPRGSPTAACTSAFDAHRSDDDEPYVFVSRGLRPDVEIAAGEPAVGLDALPARGPGEPRTCCSAAPSSALWFSLDRGPIVDEAQQQPADGGRPRGRDPPDNGEIVAATHGRSLWILRHLGAAADHGRSISRTRSPCTSRRRDSLAKRAGPRPHQPPLHRHESA